MRNISFALTTEQFLDGTKTVTRRMGWTNLKIGDSLCAVRKSQGLKAGEKIERLGIIRIVSVRREQLRALTDDLDYGLEETAKEGFAAPHAYAWPSEFVRFFCATHGCTPDDTVTRIEFERTPTKPGS